MTPEIRMEVRGLKHGGPMTFAVATVDLYQPVVPRHTRSKLGPRIELPMSTHLRRLELAELRKKLLSILDLPPDVVLRVDVHS